MLREGDEIPPSSSLFSFEVILLLLVLVGLCLSLELSLCLFLVLNLCPLVLFFLLVYFAHFLVGTFLSVLYLLIEEWNLWVRTGPGDQWTLVLSVWVFRQASFFEHHALKDLEVLASEVVASSYFSYPSQSLLIYLLSISQNTMKCFSLVWCVNFYFLFLWVWLLCLPQL